MPADTSQPADITYEIGNFSVSPRWASSNFWNSSWRSPEDVKASYPKASILKAGRTVFNIKGNDYRPVARVQYQAGVLVIRFLVTHAEYDDRCGDGFMDATMILIDSDAELTRARALVEQL